MTEEFDLHKNEGNAHLFPEGVECLYVYVEADRYSEPANRSGHPDTWHPDRSEFWIENARVECKIDGEWEELDIDEDDVVEEIGRDTIMERYD